VKRPAFANSFIVTRRLLALTCVGTLVTAAVPALGETNTTGYPAVTEDSATRDARLREHLQAHLERMATRLKINASQQQAWATYAQTVSTAFATRPSRPAADADAAAILRFRASLATTHAQRLTQVADATAKLEQVLSPEQRKTLDEIVRHQGYWHRHHHEEMRNS